MYYLELMVFSEQSVILLSQTFGLSPHCLNISIRLTNSYTHTYTHLMITNLDYIS